MRPLADGNRGQCYLGSWGVGITRGHIFLGLFKEPAPPISSQLVLNTSTTQISNMKSLVLFSCVAAATANLVTYPNGAVAPVETPEVQAAKAAHFAAKGLASPLAYAGLGHQGYATGYGYAAGYGYAPYALQAHPNGAVTPVDEPAVQVAKAQHFAAKNAEYAAHGLYAGGYAGAYAGAYAAAP
eukprot:maker-scaffold213_size254208-snap-gene-1.31 protein:Tk11730 transcript:maker-scaffold213_size254208-snap-gene-1.31-mRNA-1 annotation:"catalase"